MSNATLPTYAQFVLAARDAGVRAPDSTGEETRPEGFPKALVVWENALTGHRTYLHPAKRELKLRHIETTYISSVTVGLPDGVENGSIVGYVPADQLAQHIAEMDSDDEAKVTRRGKRAASSPVSLGALLAASSPSTAPAKAEPAAE